MLGLGQRGVPRSVAAIVAAASSPIGWHVPDGAATFTLTALYSELSRATGSLPEATTVLEYCWPAPSPEALCALEKKVTCTVSTSSEQGSHAREGPHAAR